MTMVVITNGKPVEVPRDVEAKGGRAVERYVRESAPAPPKKKRKKAAPAPVAPAPDVNPSAETDR